jgi:stearoyl-CoA desaturase (delta-9 desaturase)
MEPSLQVDSKSFGCFQSCYRVARLAVFKWPLIAVHLALFAIPFVEFTFWSFVEFFILTRISGLGITVGYHRCLAHRSFKASRPVQFALAVAGCTALQNGPLWWTAHHRMHHRNSDTPRDPHSPVVNGFLYGHMGWLFVYEMLFPDMSLVKDLTKFPELVWLERLWMIPGPMMALVCYVCFGMSGLIFGYCLGIVLMFHVTFAINSIGHLWGTQRFATGDGSRNNVILGVLAMGEGWHNNHHRAPSSARHGFMWYEFDLSYQFIRLLSVLGLAWDVKQPSAEVLTGKVIGNDEDVSSPANVEAARSIQNVSGRIF